MDKRHKHSANVPTSPKTLHQTFRTIVLVKPGGKGSVTYYMPNDACPAIVAKYVKLWEFYNPPPLPPVGGGILRCD